MTPPNQVPIKPPGNPVRFQGPTYNSAMNVWGRVQRVEQPCTDVCSGELRALVSRLDQLDVGSDHGLGSGVGNEDCR